MKEIEFSRYCWKCSHFKEQDSLTCDACLTYPMGDCTRKPVFFKENPDSAKFPFVGGIKRGRPYAYEVTYNSYDYIYAKEYYRKLSNPVRPGACSAFRIGNKLCRNLDWTYDELAEFVVHTPKQGNTHAVLGIASGFKRLTESFVDGGAYDDIYRVLPFQLYDGINDAGLSAAILVVPTGQNSGPSVPESKHLDSINGLMLVRYILDKFSSVYDAYQYIRDYVSVWFTPSLSEEYGYELHYILADSERTACLEFIDNHAELIAIDENPIVTNFHLSGVIFNNDGSVYTPETQDEEHNAIVTNNVHPYGSGLERYNFVNRCFNLEKRMAPLFKLQGDERSLLRDLRYTRAYCYTKNPSDPFWFTEFVGGDLTCGTKAEAFADVVEAEGMAHMTRTRKNANTWHTVHSGIYDLNSKTLTVEFQEFDTEYRFKI